MYNEGSIPVYCFDPASMATWLFWSPTPQVGHGPKLIISNLTWLLPCTPPPKISNWFRYLCFVKWFFRCILSETQYGFLSSVLNEGWFNCHSVNKNSHSSTFASKKGTAELMSFSPALRRLNKVKSWPCSLFYQLKPLIFNIPIKPSEPWKLLG